MSVFPLRKMGWYWRTRFQRKGDLERDTLACHAWHRK